MNHIVVLIRAGVNFDWEAQPLDLGSCRHCGLARTLSAPFTLLPSFAPPQPSSAAAPGVIHSHRRLFVLQPVWLSRRERQRAKSTFPISVLTIDGPPRLRTVHTRIRAALDSAVLATIRQPMGSRDRLRLWAQFYWFFWGSLGESSRSGPWAHRAAKQRRDCQRPEHHRHGLGSPGKMQERCALSQPPVAGCKCASVQCTDAAMGRPVRPLFRSRFREVGCVGTMVCLPMADCRERAARRQATISRAITRGPR